MRHAWPLALMRSADRVPNQYHVLEAPWIRRVFPTLGSTDCALRPVHPAKLWIWFSVFPAYAFPIAGLRYVSPCMSRTQAMRAILLASATAATLVGLLAIS